VTARATVRRGAALSSPQRAPRRFLRRAIGMIVSGVKWTRNVWRTSLEAANEYRERETLTGCRQLVARAGAAPGPAAALAGRSCRGVLRLHGAGPRCGAGTDLVLAPGAGVAASGSQATTPFAVAAAAGACSPGFDERVRRITARLQVRRPRALDTAGIFGR
jgi:hypothetical protein